MITADQSKPAASLLIAQPRTIVIGTAGHIDHGKTTLIRALTGVDTDRLPEEKRRGITIDLGFASLEMTMGDGSPLRLSFIDVPGHARFVRNMLAGAGGIDAALLVISAEEGVKPQTEEHLAICSLLGIQCGLTVLTKIDAVSETRLSEVRAAVDRFLKNTFLGSSPVIAVSARAGTGLWSLREELAALAGRVPARAAGFLPRLPLDRAFVMKGFGTVATGTLISGSIQAGQEIEIEPGSRKARVRGIEVHGRAVDKAEAPTRAALNLARIETTELHRGDTLVATSSIAAVSTIDAEITLIESAPVLKHHARIHFHAFASECLATVSLHGDRALQPGACRMARLRLDKPIVLLPEDRFVLRHGTPVTTIGGGRVLDAHPQPGLKRAAALEWLQVLRESPRAAQLGLRVRRRGLAGITHRDLATETGMSAEAIRDHLAPLIKNGSLIGLANDVLATREGIQDAVGIIARDFEKLYAESSMREVKRSELRSCTRIAAEVFDRAVEMLERDGKIRTRGEFIIAADSGDSTGERAKLQPVLSRFEQAGLAPPSPKELAGEMRIDEAEMRRTMTVLLREKKLVRLGSDTLCIHERAVAELMQTMRALRGQTIDVGRFKQLTGVSRKYAIPLLEYLDRERITRKQGDVRIVL